MPKVLILKQCFTPCGYRCFVYDDNDKLVAGCEHPEAQDSKRAPRNVRLLPKGNGPQPFPEWCPLEDYNA